MASFLEIKGNKSLGNYLFERDETAPHRHHLARPIQRHIKRHTERLINAFSTRSTAVDSDADHAYDGNDASGTVVRTALTLNRIGKYR